MNTRYLPPLRAMLQAWRLQLVHRAHFAWFLLATLVVTVALNHWVGTQYHAQRDQIDGALKVLQNQQANQAKTSQEEGAPEDLFHRRGRFVLENVPETLARDLAPWGIRGPTSAEKAHFQLTWIEPTGAADEGHLELSALEPGIDMEAPFHRLMLALEKAEHQRLIALAKSTDGFQFAPQVRLNADDAAMREQVMGMLPSVIRLMLVGLVLFGAVFLAGATLGVEWDLQRAASNLESWALSYHPLWVLYGSQALTRATQVGAVALTAVAPTLFFMDLSILTVMATTAVVVCLATSLTLLLCMWSLLSTMLFHHRYGRMFGRIVLSPFSLGAVFLFRATLLVSLFQGFSTWTTNGSNAFGWGWVGVAVLALSGAFLMTALALVPVIEARIGRRRIGLRKL
jgi:hypothetical protein